MLSVGDRVRVISDSSPFETGWTGVIIDLKPGNGDDCTVLIDQNNLRLTYEWCSLVSEAYEDSRIQYIDDFLEMLEALRLEILQVRDSISNLN